MVEPAPLQVLIFDDHQLLAHGFATVLEELSGGEVTAVGVVSDARVLHSAVRRLLPDIVLVNLELAGVNGVAVVGRVTRSCPHVPVVVQCSSNDIAEAVSALAAGAVGVLARDAEPSAVVKALASVASGMTVLPSWITDVLRDRAVRPPLLDEEQVELWRLLTRGACNVALANSLHVSDRTLKRKIHVLLQTLGVRSRLEAAALGGRAGLLDDASSMPEQRSISNTRRTP